MTLRQGGGGWKWWGDGRIARTGLPKLCCHGSYAGTVSCPTDVTRSIATVRVIHMGSEPSGHLEVRPDVGTSGCRRNIPGSPQSGAQALPGTPLEACIH